MNMFADTVTIFHKTEIDDVISWSKAFIRRVHFENEYKKMQSGTEMRTFNVTYVTIPSARGGETAVYYLPGVEFRQDDDSTLVFDGRQDAFAVSLGDIVIKGEIDDIIADYDSGNAIVAKYGTDAFRIAEVKDNTNAGIMANLYLGG